MTHSEVSFIFGLHAQELILVWTTVFSVVSLAVIPFGVVLFESRILQGTIAWMRENEPVKAPLSESEGWEEFRAA